MSKLFTSKADYKERTTFVRARPSWIPLLPSPDVTSLMPNTVCVDGVGWTAERGVFPYNTVYTQPGWGRVRGNISPNLPPPSPHFTIFASKDMLLNYISIRRYKNVNKEEE